MVDGSSFAEVLIVEPCRLNGTLEIKDEGIRRGMEDMIITTLTAMLEWRKHNNKVSLYPDLHHFYFVEEAQHRRLSGYPYDAIMLERNVSCPQHLYMCCLYLSLLAICCRCGYARS